MWPEFEMTFLLIKTVDHIKIKNKVILKFSPVIKGR